MAKNKTYRVVQNEGKATFRIEELWEGGEQRGPFGSKEAAIKREEAIAQENGFIDNLALEGVVAKEVSLTESFEKDSDGDWHCKQGCSIEIGNKEVVFTAGMKFKKGEPFIGVEVAEWLDENVKGK